METYVTSLHWNAKLAHIGNSYWTACGFICTDNFTVTKTVPPGRTVCVRCAARYEPLPPNSPEAKRIRRLSLAEERRLEQERLILDQLRAGKTNRAIVRSLRIGTRTFVRRTSRMRARAGARTTWQWAYFVGLNERQAGK